MSHKEKEREGILCVITIWDSFTHSESFGRLSVVCVDP